MSIKDGEPISAGAVQGAVHNSGYHTRYRKDPKVHIVPGSETEAIRSGNKFVCKRCGGSMRMQYDDLSEGQVLKCLECARYDPRTRTKPINYNH